MLSYLKKIKLRTRIILSLLVLLICWIAILQLQIYHFPEPDVIRKRVNYLQRIVNEPLKPGSSILALGNENYEWMLFSYSFSSYAMTNLAIHDPTYRNQAVKIIKTSIERALEPIIYSSFGINDSLFKSDSIPGYSVLYLGHLNLMLGCYRLISKDTIYDCLNDKISKSLFQRYSKSEFLNLESYPLAIWIPDNTVALASLKMHSLNTGSDYESICNKWVEYARQHYIDKETGVLFSTIDSKTGQALEEPRGSMLGWSIMFIYQFDSNFSKELYQNFKNNFSCNYLIFRLFKERNKSMNSNVGDLDSGPLFLGYSIPANEFALSNSILSGDYKTAKKIERLIDFGTTEVGKNNELKYRTKFTEINISPMAEALVLYSLTIINWDRK
jgi:hypothetical protein